ncbi:flagellin lysine-N-methylase [Telluria beijingensis]|uniref:flagellin lysine-N-methylase n=1 Tax=Telluria beijingensis TaxID=3068633 RepID=UPI00279570E8|nr:flagellin lysine-N-methylase [Massilia sp. REN29]
MPILHRTQSVSALMPRFVERFRCIGPSCEDTCCSGWTIFIDKKSYKAYRAEDNPAFEQLNANMLRRDNPANTGEYAMIKTIGAQKQCPALQDSMCAVQAHLGESYLSHTCHTYPRTNRSLLGQVEQSITLSCPEAARLALLAEDAFDFVEAPVQLRLPMLSPVNQAFGIAPELMSEVRMFCMNLMRTRELPLWQRLALLGTFCETLTQLCSANEQANIPTMIDDFVRLIENGELMAVLEPIQPDHTSQAMVFATLWAEKGFEATSPFQQAMMRKIASRFGANAHGEVSAEALVGAYRRGLARLDEALLPTPWLLENYVVNEIYSQFVPFNGKSPYDGYLQLISRFGLLRMLLAVQCNTEGDPPSSATLASTVNLHCRRFQHDPSYATRVREALYDSGWAEMSRLYKLLRT